MYSNRRALALASVAVLAIVVWTGWSAYQTAQDLRSAESAVERFRLALEEDDSIARSAALDDLTRATSSAHQRTSGSWWGALEWTPWFGDDVAGVRALSASLDLVATGAASPLAQTVDSIGPVMRNGRVDLTALGDLAVPVTAADSALSGALAIVAEQNTSGFVGPFRYRYDRYVDDLASLAGNLSSADTALDVLPGMLGADGPRRYLMIFENNAEIRATGGLPGSWALVTAREGSLSLGLQGAASDFQVYSEPIGSITAAEEAMFGSEMGRYFQDPNFTPDFPRAAEVFNEFWERQFPGDALDGVVAVDTVALSYILEGTGPVDVGPMTLTAERVVEQLLSDVYLEPDTDKQNQIFEQVARGMFDAVTGDVPDPLAVLEGIARATREGRFRVASFRESETDLLAGTRVVGALTKDSGVTPRVDIALNDASASKLSYYLRYRVQARSLSCSGGVQRLGSTMTLGQTLTPERAESLPEYVLGPRFAGADAGDQLVRIHVIAPFDGKISEVRIDGKAVPVPDMVDLNGRPAVTLAVLVQALADSVVTFTMETGPGQTADTVVGLTPSVVQGGSVQSVKSAC